MEKLNDISVFHRHESKVRGYCRRFDAVFASACGSIMRDVDGREYIDFLAACGSMNYGHNDPDMRATLIEHITGNGIAAGLDLFTIAKRAFLDRFHSLILAPRGMDYRVQFTGPTGTNAVEAALKLARKVTGRNNVIAFTNGFHGVSLGSLAATGNKYNRMGALLPGVSRAAFHRYFGPDIDTADYLDRMLSDPSSGIDTPAAIILETVQGEGGLNAASHEWVRKIAALAKHHGALLIIDDIQFIVYLPIPFLIAHHYFGADHDRSSTTIAASMTEPASLSHLPAVLGWTSLFFAGTVLAGLALVIVVPRLLNAFLQPDKVYPLYGIHFFTHRNIERLSNAKFYNVLFGDSSFIVHYLKVIGYKFRSLEQTGSNFGLSQQHDNPFLREIGRGTIASDGLHLLNTEYSATTFRVSKVSIGAHNFIGNAIFFPPQGRTGENCLLGTKAMIPIDGPLRENIGLLGSPCFEIPRSVRRDTQFDFYKQKDVLRHRLTRKNASNAVTILFFLLSNCIALNIATIAWYYTYGSFNEHGPLYLAVLTIVTLAVLTPYYILVDWASLGFRRLQPQYCSIYDDYFWKHERHWKLGMSNDQFLMAMLNGTPFKSLVWRALGVRTGRKLFDDGASIPEKTLVTIGDNCTLNDHCTLQSHSLEDGTFKSDHIVIENRCTIGANCYVHYGVQMENGVTLEPDSFLMKGERPETGSTWQGNPAKEILE